MVSRSPESQKDQGCLNVAEVLSIGAGKSATISKPRSRLMLSVAINHDPWYNQGMLSKQGPSRQQNCGETFLLPTGRLMQVHTGEFGDLTKVIDCFSLRVRDCDTSVLELEIGRLPF